MLFVGVEQFSTASHVEIHITSDLSAVKQKLPSIPQKSGGTQFITALKLCQSQLTNFQVAGADTFDICILITDGASSDGIYDQGLARILANKTALFGIYVGTDGPDANRLGNLSRCGAADYSPTCHYFAKAVNFTALQKAAGTVANQVKKGTDSLVPPTCNTPTWPWWALLGFVPFLLWWIYLQLVRKIPDVVPIEPVREVHNPLPPRLHGAGRNELR
jgi:hypothetical protein